MKYTLVALATMTGFVATAQQVSVGARGGVTLSTLTRPDLIQGFTENARPLTSANGGVFAEIAFGNHFALRPELAYVQKGIGAYVSTNVAIAGMSLPVGGRVNLRVSHLQMPVLAQYSFGQGPVRGYVVGGPAVAVAMNAKLVTRPELLLEFRPIRINIDLDLLQYKRFEVSGIAGAGLSIDLGGSGTKLMLEGRYEHGLTRVIDVPVVRINTFNQNVSFLAGIAIPVGGR